MKKRYLLPILMAGFVSLAGAEEMCLYASGDCWPRKNDQGCDAYGWVFDGGKAGEGTLCQGGTFTGVGQNQNPPTGVATSLGCCKWAENNSAGKCYDVYTSSEATDCDGGENTFWSSACPDKQGTCPGDSPGNGGGGSGKFCYWGAGNCYGIGGQYDETKTEAECTASSGTVVSDCNNPGVTSKYCNWGPCVNGSGWECEEGGCFAFTGPDSNCEDDHGTVVSSCPAGTQPPAATPILKVHHAMGLLVVTHGRALHISSAKDANITLYTLSGQQVLTGVARAGNSVFSLMNQNPGVYYAVVKSGAYTQTVNVILK